MSKWDKQRRTIGRWERIHGWHWQWHRIPTQTWNHREKTEHRVQVYGEFCTSAINRPILHLDWYDNDEIGFGICYGTEGSDPALGIDFEVRLREPFLTWAIRITKVWREWRGKDWRA